MLPRRTLAIALALLFVAAASLAMRPPQGGASAVQRERDALGTGAPRQRTPAAAPALLQAIPPAPAGLVPRTKPRGPGSIMYSQGTSSVPPTEEPGMPHDTMKAECAHAGNGACWTWACTCGGHGHVEDPAARYEAASSHANAGHGPCLSLMLGHDPPVECGAC